MINMKINNFQFKKITWSTRYLGNVPRTKIAREIKNIILTKNRNIFFFIRKMLLLQQ